MARKKTIDELRIEREKAEQDLKLRQENLKKLKAKEAELRMGTLTIRNKVRSKEQCFIQKSRLTAPMRSVWKTFSAARARP